jgi:hypothetical protein
MSTFSSAVLAVSAILAAPHLPPAPDACTLITKEDAAAAIGEAATGPNVTKERTDGAGNTVSGCEYTGSGYHRVQVILTRLPNSSVAIFQGTCKGKDSKGLTGLGEVACWYNEKHEELHAFKGDVFVSVQLNRSGDPTESIKAMMKKAIEHLK